MRFHPDSINRITDLIYKEQMTYNCSIVIGDNSGGKSFLVKTLVKKWLNETNVYFIDAVNRNFDASRVTQQIEKPEYKGVIVETRLREAVFNILDSFNCYGTSTERVEQIYTAFEKAVQDRFERLTDETFQILYGDPLGEVRFSEGNRTLSSGYQALVRIILELTFYYEMEIVKKNVPSAWTVIDEVDEFLSPKYASKILPFLRNEFPRLKFVIITHSIDLVVTAQDANIVILDQAGFEVLDANDYNSYSEVERIFDRVFGGCDKGVSEIDTILRRLMNNKINNAWSDEDEKKLAELNGLKLSASQKLVYRQIMEW